MKKLRVLFSLILVVSLLLAGCDWDIEDEPVSVSGDLAYYAEMDADSLEETCEGNYIEVSGTVDLIYQNIGTVYLGNSLSDRIRFSCDLSNVDDALNIEEGDLVVVRGKCSSCIGSTLYLKNCEIEEYTGEAESELPLGNSTSTTELTAITTNAATTTTTTHIHSFNVATCIAPKTCACGATEGKANGHDWKAATCSEPKTCTVCGTTSGLTAGHDFSNGKCVICGKADPDYHHETMVWIPTKGGTKYHTRAGCSNMDDPEQVTKSEAESLGFTPCKRCH